MAEHWALQVMQDKASSADKRLRGMFTRAFSRQPSKAEAIRWLAALQSFGGDTPAAWESLAHTFFNAKEFIYFR